MKCIGSDVEYIVIYDGGSANFTEKEWAEFFIYHLEHTGHITWAKLNEVETSPFDEHPINVETILEFDWNKKDKRV